MAFPIGLGIAGLGLAGKIFGKGKRLSDDPEVKRALAMYERLASDVGAEAEVEQQFRPARAQVSRRITALGPPGASGAVSGAFAELEGQKAAVKAGLQRSAKTRLADIRLSLAGKKQPSFLGGMEDDLLGIGLSMAFPPKLNLPGAAVSAPAAPSNGAAFPTPGSRRGFELRGNTGAPSRRRRYY